MNLSQTTTRTYFDKFPTSACGSGIRSRIRSRKKKMPQIDDCYCFFVFSQYVSHFFAVVVSHYLSSRAERKYVSLYLTHDMAEDNTHHVVYVVDSSALHSLPFWQRFSRGTIYRFLCNKNCEKGIEKGKHTLHQPDVPTMISRFTSVKLLHWYLTLHRTERYRAHWRLNSMRLTAIFFFLSAATSS